MTAAELNDACLRAMHTALGAEKDEKALLARLVYILRWHRLNAADIAATALIERVKR